MEIKSVCPLKAEHGCQLTKEKLDESKKKYKIKSKPLWDEERTTRQARLLLAPAEGFHQGF